MFSQSNSSEKHNFSSYLKQIQKGEKPKTDGITIDYQEKNEYRIISYRENIIKKYKYDDEVLDKLGFVFMEKNIFRHCDFHIIFTRRKNRDNTITVWVEWFGNENDRARKPYFMYCK